MIRLVAKTFYKRGRFGNRPPCLICMGPGQGQRAEVHLPHGVSVWLCAEHRSLEFQRQRSGRDFAVTLGWAWDAAGCLTARRRRALAAHRTRLLSEPAERGRPGSYSWPALRREAERRAADGEAPAAVIRSVRSLAGGGAAVPPGPHGSPVDR